jgi:Rap1a immunity proteins
MRADDGHPPTPGQALCLGAFETFHWFSSIGELQGNARFCIPPDNTTQDVIQAFVDFALKHRDLLDKRAQFVMELAMHDRWPC